jgi:hypothetical protein
MSLSKRQALAESTAVHCKDRDSLAYLSVQEEQVSHKLSHCYTTLCLLITRASMTQFLFGVGCPDGKCSAAA